MKSAKFQKIKREQLPVLPAWWQETLKDAQNSSLAQMSEEEIGKWVETLAARKKQPATPQPAK